MGMVESFVLDVVISATGVIERPVFEVVATATGIIEKPVWDRRHCNESNRKPRV